VEDRLEGFVDKERVDRPELVGKLALVGKPVFRCRLVYRKRTYVHEISNDPVFF